MRTEYRSSKVLCVRVMLSCVVFVINWAEIDMPCGLDALWDATIMSLMLEAHHHNALVVYCNENHRNPNKVKKESNSKKCSLSARLYLFA